MDAGPLMLGVAVGIVSVADLFLFRKKFCLLSDLFMSNNPFITLVTG